MIDQKTQPLARLGKPRPSHGSAIHALVERCPPLDLNSTYAYLLLCEHFADTCVQAEAEGKTVGFVSAYQPPGRHDVIFVWQVAVDPALRGRRLANQMLHELLRRDRSGAWKYLETTVSPSNTASRRLFYSLAEALHARVTEKVLFRETDFGTAAHEEEVLIRIGPISQR